MIKVKDAENHILNIALLLWSFLRPTNALGTGVLFFLILVITNATRDYRAYLLLIAFVFPLMWFLNSFNDIYDINTDEQNPKKNNIWYGHVLQRKDIGIARTFGWVSGLTVLLTSIITRDWVIIAVVGIGLVLGYWYSAPPMRLKEKVFVYYIITCLPLLAFVLIATRLGGTVSQRLFRGLISIWLLMTSISALAESADFDSDKQAGIKTAATRWGIRWPICLALLTWICGTALSFANIPPAFQIYCLSVIPVIVYLLIRSKSLIIARFNAAIAFSAIVPISIELIHRLF